jgi:hypothetical protein
MGQGLGAFAKKKSWEVGMEYRYLSRESGNENGISASASQATNVVGNPSKIFATILAIWGRWRRKTGKI